MSIALKGVPVHQAQPPDGVVRIKDEWYFEENTPATGIASLGLDAGLPSAPSDSDRKSILDLFKP